MTTIATVNVDLLIAKLLLTLERVERGANKNYAQVDAALIEMAVRAMEQQKARIAELEADAALVEAAMPSGNTHQLPIGKNPPTLPPNVTPASVEAASE